MRSIVSCLLGTLVITAGAAWAGEPEAPDCSLVSPRKCLPGEPRRLESHEPNYIGYNKDEGLAGHLDFKVSVKYSLRRYSRPYLDARPWDRVVPQVAFSARLSQFIGSQDSSPVVGRRFNPELFVRLWRRNACDYLDLAYGHESNGQSVNSSGEFRAKKAGLIRDGDDPAFADKFVSRGWDYAGVTWRKGLAGDAVSDSDEAWRLVFYGKARYFFSQGLLQDGAEEFFDFEPGSARQRAEYDGLTFTLRLDSNRGWGWKTAFVYRTGYKDAFRNNTARFELTAKEVPLFGTKLPVPVTAWAQTGYNADLATYYRHSYTVGIGIELE